MNAPYTLLINAASFFARLYLTSALHYIRYLHVLCPALKLRISAVLSLIVIILEVLLPFQFPLPFLCMCCIGHAPKHTRCLHQLEPQSIPLN